MSDPRVLFVMRPGSRAGWYRCVLPAMFNGWDWAAIGGDPPGLELHTSWVKGSTLEPDIASYDVVVMQQARGERWRALIRKMQGLGIVVVYEVDDYVHGVRTARDHDFSGQFQKHHLKQMEVCMRQCDGVVFSTRHLADKYDRLARRSWVCENGLDMGRYRLTRPPHRGDAGGRETVTILWAGATGHKFAALPWLRAVAEVMDAEPHVTFASVGQNFASALSDFPNRVLSVPFTAIETYPAAMMLGDVAIAPAGDSEWFKCKSDLRAMEAAALGIPVVADKKYAGAVEDGATGLLVNAAPGALDGDRVIVSEPAVARIKSALLRLIRDEELRWAMSARAREKALAEFGMERRAGAWREMVREASAVRSRVQL